MYLHDASPFVFFIVSLINKEKGCRFFKYFYHLCIRKVSFGNQKVNFHCIRLLYHLK